MRRGGVKSFVDDLVLGRGVVISRAATSLRSVETQPLTRRFVRIRRATISDFTVIGESSLVGGGCPYWAGRERRGARAQSSALSALAWPAVVPRSVRRFDSCPGLITCCCVRLASG